MKALITILLLISTAAQGQIITKEMVKPLAVKSSLLFVSGFFDGTSEVLKVKYNSFERVFPNANKQFWDYNQSWTNKYSTYPKPKFIGSTNALVWTTDGYHLTRMIRNCTMIAALTIPIGKHKPKKWYSYAAEAGIYYLSYTSGFNFAYDVIFK